MLLCVLCTEKEMSEKVNAVEGEMCESKKSNSLIKGLLFLYKSQRFSNSRSLNILLTSKILKIINCANP